MQTSCRDYGISKVPPEVTVAIGSEEGLNYKVLLEFIGRRWV